ncbi:unnamed protein product [Calypogeia fissa]
MADFASSTHRHHWILPRQKLVEKGRAANERARDALRKYGATRIEVQSDGSLAYPGISEEGENGAADKGPLPEPLSLEEELLVQKYYERKIQEVCAAFSFPNKIQATAIFYFKRFYLNWSVMEHDPKHIMLTCIYLSCKVEEFHVSAEELGKGIQQDPQVLLKNEMTVLQGLDFELIVYTPYRALDGYAFDLTNSARRMGVTSLNHIQELRDAARFEVDAMMLTNAPLLFTPGQLAMAALRKANREERKVDLERYMKGLSESLALEHSYSELASALDAIDAVVMDNKQTAEAEVKRIDRKLKICRNPGLQDENKKRERKGKHKQRRGQALPTGQDVSSTDMDQNHGVKRKAQ